MSEPLSASERENKDNSSVGISLAAQEKPSPSDGQEAVAPPRDNRKELLFRQAESLLTSYAHEGCQWDADVWSAVLSLAKGDNRAAEDWPLVMPVPPDLRDPRYSVYLDLRDLVMVAYRHSVANTQMARLHHFIERNYREYLATCSTIELSPIPTSPSGTPTPPSDGEGEAARSEAEPTEPKAERDGVVAPTSGEADPEREETTRGHVIWHTSEEDGPPDVGMSLGLGDGRMLWLGEMPNATLEAHGIDVKETGDGWWFVLYGNRAVDTHIAALAVDTTAAQEMFDHIAAVVRQSTPSSERLSSDRAGGGCKGSSVAPSRETSDGEQMTASEPKPKRGELRVLDGLLCRFIERELEGDKWMVLGPAPQRSEMPHPTEEGRRASSETLAEPDEAALERAVRIFLSWGDEEGWSWRSKPAEAMRAALAALTVKGS